MANPQLENGFVRIANELLEALARAQLSGNEYRIVLCVLRRTYGHNRKAGDFALHDLISLSGLSKVRCCQVLAILLARNVIISSSSDGNKSRRLSIQKDYEKWVMPDGKRFSKVKQTFLKSETNISQKCNKRFSKVKQTFLKSEIITVKDKDKRQKTKEYIYEFSELWKLYPLQDGMRDAEKAYQNSVLSVIDAVNIKRALDNYLLHLRANPWKNPKTGKRWFESWQDWVHYREPEHEKRLEALLSELKVDIAGMYRSLEGMALERQEGKMKQVKGKERIVALLESGAWSLAVYDEYCKVCAELRLLPGHAPERIDLQRKIAKLFTPQNKEGVAHE
ncbi:MAG TPA: replication protein [Dissulfurispiraceae bacterium]|nr:replication protein [Dissulfurispiraceae bacterium]